MRAIKPEPLKPAGPDRVLGWLLIVAFLATFVIVELSAWLRLQEAGIGCGNFPDCYGYFQHLPEKENGSASPSLSPVKKFHRSLASLLVLITGVIAYRVFRKQHASTALRYCILLTILLLIVLSFIGPYTAQKQYPILAVANGGLGILLLLSIAAAWYFADARKHGIAPDTRLHAATKLGLVLVIGIIVSGIWSSANYTSAALPVAGEPPIDMLFPRNTSVADAFNPARELAVDQNHRVLPDAAIPAIRAGHLWGGLIFVPLISLLCIAVIRKNPQLRRPAALVLILVLIECLLGAFSLFGAPSAFLMPAHHLTAVLLALALLNLVLISLPGERHE